MTSRHNSSVARLALAVFGSSIWLAASAQAQEDQCAAWMFMFNGSSSHSTTPPPYLFGGQPPVIGRQTSLIMQAPGFQSGIVVLSATPTSGIVLTTGSHAINVYLAASLLATFPVVFLSGQATLSFLLPNDPSAVGVNLAWQGLSSGPAGLIGTTNLLVSNFGVSATEGTAVLCTAMRAEIKALSWFVDQASGIYTQPVLCNEGNTMLRVRFRGTKTANVGPIKFVTASSVAPILIPKVDSTFDFTFDVPGRYCVGIYNTDPSSSGVVTWRVATGPTGR